jgi:hypothetical protein
LMWKIGGDHNGIMDGSGISCAFSMGAVEVS